MCHCFLAQLTADDLAKYGPVAPMVGLVLSLVAAAGAVIAAGFGPRKRAWDIPDAGAPKFGPTAVRIVTVAFIVLGVLWAAPETLPWITLIAVLLVVVFLVALTWYQALIGLHRYFKPEVKGNRETVQIPLLGGSEVRPEAEEAMKIHGLPSEQDLLPGTKPQPYNAEFIWTRKSRVRVLTKVLWAYMVTLFAGASALAWLALALQVKLTGKPAAAVVSAKDVPGLNTK
jgi:hypothetical protein